MIKKSIAVSLVLIMSVLAFPGTATHKVIRDYQPIDSMRDTTLCNHAQNVGSTESRSDHSNSDCVFSNHCSFHSCGSFGMTVSVLLSEFELSNRFSPPANVTARNLLPPPEIRPPIFIF